MSFKHDPADCLEDIVENAEHVAGYVSGMTEAEFNVDRRTRDAVERCIERVCEAARRLGEHSDELVPDQPWAKIRGMGNWLRHGYHRVEIAIVWETATAMLPPPLAAARIALAKLDAAQH